MVLSFSAPKINMNQENCGVERMCNCAEMAFIKLVRRQATTAISL